MATLRYRAVIASAAATALLVAGCGSGHHAPPTTSSATGLGRAPTRLPAIGATIPTPGPTGDAASPSAVKVIEGWSTALRTGHLVAAAMYFALPSRFINGSEAGAVPVLTIHDAAQAQAVNAWLPCGAKLISADQRGRFVNALFRLTGRPGPGGSSCSGGAGATARTNFIIADGKILEWIRAPDDTGDNRAPTPPATPNPIPTPTPTPTPTQPQSPQGVPVA